MASTTLTQSNPTEAQPTGVILTDTAYGPVFSDPNLVLLPGESVQLSAARYETQTNVGTAVWQSTYSNSVPIATVASA